MDILNFISWIKGGRVVTSVDPAKTLIPVGLKDDRRDDGYLAGAITVEDFAAQLTPPVPEPTYKVYTALLTQTGTNAPVATVLENTLGGTPVWDYAGTGQYYATLIGAFTVDKTTVSITMSGTATVAQANTNAIRLTNSLAGVEPDVIVISCSKADTGVGANDLFTKAFIEIRVYN